jgi:hypothetical protein
MKSKFSKSFFTVLCIVSTMMACQPKKSEDTASNKDDARKKPVAQQSGECELCHENDTYKIELDEALTLICAFHNNVLKNGSNITNAGGVFSLKEFKQADKVNFNDYPTAKFHWALEDSASVKGKRLFITYEPSNKQCDLITPGIEGDDLYTTYADNDIAPLIDKSTNLDRNQALRGLARTFSIKQKHFRKADKEVAERLLINFKSDRILTNLYKCDDVVFNYELTLRAIQTESRSEQFLYFFGYDEKNSIHKLRLIVAGLDENNQLVFYNADGKSLMRETSRPHP